MDDQEQRLLYMISATKDELLREELANHLYSFVQVHHLALKHSQMIPLGESIQGTKDQLLRQASMILVLLSSDCLNECAEEIRLLASLPAETPIFPLLLRPVDLDNTPFKGLNYLPQNKKPVTSQDQDAAFQDIVRHLRQTIASPDGTIRDTQKKKLQTLLASHTAFLNNRLSSFVGREQELRDIQTLIVENQEQGGYITITGQAGQGKSSIIAKLIDIYGSDQVASHFLPLRPGPDHQVSLLRHVMARLCLKHTLSDLYVEAESRPALRDYFHHLLWDLAAKQHHEIIFLDGLDQLEEDLNGRRDLSFLPDHPPPGIVFILGTRPDDTLAPLQLLQPLTEYRLPNLSREDFHLILARREVHIVPSLVDQLYQSMQANALYLDLVAKELHEHASLTPQQVIERIADNPENLFSLSFQRLKHDRLEWQHVLKPILGLLLTTQEPLWYGHLRQLLPLVEDERLREGLRKLGGLLHVTGTHAYALFHLKLQAYLRADEQDPHKEHLFARDEEESYHAQLAQWCEHVNLADIWKESLDRGEQSRRAYARRHFILHLYAAQLDQHLFAVLDEGSYGQAKEQYDRTARSYMQDLDLGRKAAARSHRSFDESVRLLPTLWRYTLLRCSLRSWADNYPESLFATLLLFHRESEVVGLAELLTKPQEKVKVLLQVGIHYGSQPDKQTEQMQAFFRARRIAQAIQDPQTRAYMLRNLAQSLAESQQWEQADEIAREIEQVEFRVQALCIIAQVLVAHQRWKQASDLLKELEEILSRREGSRFKVQMLCELAQMQAASQQRERAEKLLTEAEEVARGLEEAEIRVQVLSTIAQTVAENNQWERAEKLLKEAEETSSGREETNTEAWIVPIREQAFVRILAANQQWERTKEVARKIKQAGFKTYMLCEIAQALVARQQWEQAEALLAEAEEVASGIEESVDRAQALSEVARTLAESQQWKRAEEVASSIGTSGVQEAQARTHALSSVAQTLAKSQRWGRAETIARGLAKSASRVQALSVIAQTLAENHQWERAERLLAEAKEAARGIDDAWSNAWALSVIAQTLAENHQWERAEEVASGIEQPAFSRAKALSAIAQALAENHQWERAEKLLTEAEAIAKEIDDEWFRARALSTIAQMFAASQQWERVRKVASGAGNALFRAQVLSEIAQALIKSQQWEQGEEFLAEAEVAAREVAEKVTRASAFGTVARSLAKSQRWERAEEVAKRIEEPEIRAWALNTLVQSLAASQQWERAEEVAREIEDTNIKSKALNASAQSFVHFLAKNQQWERAEEVARGIEETVFRVQSLSIIAQMLLTSQQWKRAETLLKEAEEEAGEIERPEIRVQVLSTIAQIFAESQCWEKAGVLLKNAEEVARGIEDAWSRGQALNTIVQALGKSQQWDTLVRLLQRSWLFAETREHAMNVFSPVAGLIVAYPLLERDFMRAFEWVDAFLH